MFDNLANLRQENKMNWYEGLSRAVQAYHELRAPTGVSPHVAVIGRDLSSTQLSWNQPGLALNAEEFVPKQKELRRLISDSLRREHDAADDRRD